MHEATILVNGLLIFDIRKLGKFTIKKKNQYKSWKIGKNAFLSNRIMASTKSEKGRNIKSRTNVTE